MVLQALSLLVVATTAAVLAGVAQPSLIPA
jgi:hypothetical protein